jgi:hypothetical protein
MLIPVSTGTLITMYRTTAGYVKYFETMPFRFTRDWRIK